MKNANEINIYFNYKISLNEKKLKEGINRILERENKRNINLNLIFVDNAKIKEVNLEYRNKNYPTDIIAFPLRSFKKLEGGDIFISIEKVKENAKKYEKSFLNELKRIIVHGVLHIIGYDHASIKQKRKMFIKQENYLKLLMGIENK